MVHRTTNAMIYRMTRVKVTVTLDPELLGAVDGFVQSHPGQDRSKVIDQALHQWYSQRQETEMELQYSHGGQRIGSERKAWWALRRAAASRRLGPTEPTTPNIRLSISTRRSLVPVHARAAG